MTKAELEKKKKLARTLYMAGKDQNEIADQIDAFQMGQPGRMEGAAGCHKRDPPGAGKQAAT